MRPIMAHQEKPFGDIKIAIINKAIIFRDEPFPVGAIPCGDLVPWHHGLGMVGGMEVVIKE